MLDYYSFGIMRNMIFRFYCVKSSSCIKSVSNMEVPCSKARGRPRKTWSDCVKADMNACSLRGIDPQNRTAWRSGIRSISRLLPYPSYLDKLQQLKNKIRTKSSQVHIAFTVHLCVFQTKSLKTHTVFLIF